MSKAHYKPELRRENYTSILGEQEYFVTPLLRTSITEAFKMIGTPVADATVLDIGAGECPLRVELEQAGYRYLSLDIGQNSTETIDFVARIDQPLPEKLLRSKAFDLLILTEVLEHVPDWRETFQNLATILKPGGHCVITVPFLYMPHEEPHDYWRPTDHALRYFAKANDFEVVFSRRNGDGWDVLGTLLCSTTVCRKKKNIAAYFATVPIWCVHNVLKLFFTSSFLRKSVEFQTRYYLGNFFVLRKT